VNCPAGAPSAIGENGPDLAAGELGLRPGPAPWGRAAPRIFDRLQEAFQPDQLLMDIDNIAPGLDYG
jgi:hypothetical protein